MRIHRYWLRALFAFALPISGVHAEASLRYDVQIAASGIADVTLCDEHASVRAEFRVDAMQSKTFVDNVHRPRGKAAAKSGAALWEFAGWRADDCLAYTADLAALSLVHGEAGSHYGDVWVLDPSYWLIRPATADVGGADVTVRLPDSMTLSAPWRDLGRDAKGLHFHVPATPDSWSGSVAIGRMAQRRIALDGATMRVDDLTDSAPDVAAKLDRWLGAAAREVQRVDGTFPVPEVRILIVPVAKLSVPFRFFAWLYPNTVYGGESARGQGNSIEFVVDPRMAESEFSTDWTAYHELSHLMHPYLGDRGSWLSEGLATYYQTVLRARAGVIVADDAWNRFAEGFEEVESAPAGARLEDVAADVGRSGRYTYMYRAGAVYWMSVDVDLRRASGGRVTLDSALAAFRQCCLPSYRQWQPQEFVDTLDRLLHVDVFARRFAQFRDTKSFPDWRRLYAQLRVKRESVPNAGSAPDLSDIRRAIMLGRVEKG